MVNEMLSSGLSQVGEILQRQYMKMESNIAHLALCFVCDYSRYKQRGKFRSEVFVGFVKNCSVASLLRRMTSQKKKILQDKGFPFQGF